MRREMNENQLHTHVKLLGWLHIVGELIGLAVGGLLFALLAGIGVAVGDPDAMRVLPVVGFFILGVIVLFSLPGLLAGIGLLRRWAWARYLALLVGCVDLLWVPIGTMIGIYTFWVLLQRNAPAYFERGDALDGLDDRAFEMDYEPSDARTNDVVPEVYYRGDDIR